MSSEYRLPAGTWADGPYDLLVTPESAGRGYSGLRILTLRPGETHALSSGESEFLVLPPTGSRTVTTDGGTFELTGRTGVFSSATDFAHLPRESAAVIGGAAGACSRQVDNHCLPGAYFEVSGENGFGYQRDGGTSRSSEAESAGGTAERPIDLPVEVRSGVRC